MAKHTVDLRIDHEIPIGNVDVEFPVKTDGKAFGRLQVSKGGVDWMPARSHRSGYWLTWTEFADLIKEHGRPKQ